MRQSRATSFCMVVISLVQFVLRMPRPRSLLCRTVSFELHGPWCPGCAFAQRGPIRPPSSVSLMRCLETCVTTLAPLTLCFGGHYYVSGWCSPSVVRSPFQGRGVLPFWLFQGGGVLRYWLCLFCTSCAYQWLEGSMHPLLAVRHRDVPCPCQLFVTCRPSQGCPMPLSVVCSRVECLP
jgi:hypothetical protein